jgi:hypothetical protein
MHGHSIAAAVGMTGLQDFSQTTRVLGVVGVSGCFSIVLAHLREEIRCSVMEPPTMKSKNVTPQKSANSASFCLI